MKKEKVLGLLRASKTTDFEKCEKAAEEISRKIKDLKITVIKKSVEFVEPEKELIENPEYLIVDIAQIYNELFDKDKKRLILSVRANSKQDIKKAIKFLKEKGIETKIKNMIEIELPDEAFVRLKEKK